MPGTLLLKDYESANEDELKQHLADLMARAPTPSDSLTNPVIQPAPAPEPVPLIAPPEPTPEPPAAAQDTRDELQAHVDSLMAPPTPADTSAPPTPTPAPVTEPTPSVPSSSSRPLQLLGEGLTSLNAGAQNVRQELQNHLTSLIAPPTTADVAGAPSPDTTVQHDPSPPVQTAGTQIANTPDASGRVFPLAAKPSNEPSATYHSQGGSDLMAPRGTPVLNMQSGKVEEVFTDNGSHTVGGNAVLIHGDDGLDYYYAHFDQPSAVKIGQRVSAGEQIGAVGNSGNAWKGGDGATHLHIGIGHGISNGVGSEGGLGENFNAQQLLGSLQSGIGHATTAARGALESAGTTIRNTVQQALQPSGRIPAQLNVPVDQGPSITREQANMVVHGTPLEGYGDTLYDLGVKYNVDPAFALSVARNESNYGSMSAQQRNNNIFSISNAAYGGQAVPGSRWGQYPDKATAIEAFYKLLTNEYYSKGQNTIGSVMWGPNGSQTHAYAPTSENSPDYPQRLIDTMRGYGSQPGQVVAAGAAPAAPLGFTAPGGSTDQRAASVDQPRPLQLIGEGLSSLGSAAQGGLKIIDNAIQQVADTSGPQTAAMQPTPSDTLTNPLGTSNAPQPSAALTGQPAGGIAEPTGPAVLPALDQARQALRNGDLQGAQDALGQAREAVATSAVGPALGVLRGPSLLSDEEALRSREATTARDMLEQINAAAVAKGQTPEPITDADVANTARSLMTGQAVAMTGEGFGRPTAAKPTTAAADMQARWLQDQPVVPTSDPRPATGDVQFGGKDVKRVTQASLDEITPQGATLYHETSVPSAGALLERIEAGPRSHDSIFTSDNRDLALGQGGKGVMLEFEPARTNGGVAPQKPGLPFTAATGGGQEYTIGKTLPGAVKAIVVQTQRQADQLAKSARIARRFDFAAAEQTPEGIRIPYRERPAPEVTPAAPVERAPATVPEAAPATAAERVPVAAGADTGGSRTPESVARGEAAGAPPSSVPPVAPAAAGSADETLRAGNILLPKYVQQPVRELIAETYRVDPARFEAAKRGTMTLDEIKELAEHTGTSVKNITDRWQPGQAKNAETLQAMRQGLADRALRVKAAQYALREAPNSLDARATLVEALAQHAAIQEAVQGVTGEAGRALGALRLPVQGEEASLRLLQRLAKEKGLTPAEMAEQLTKVNLDDPANVAVLARQLSSHTLMDKATALWYFALLSNPMTHIKNTISNALVAATRPVESLASAGVDIGRYGVERALRRPGARRERFFGEVPEQLFGSAASLPDGLKSAYRMLRTGVSEKGLANPELAGRAEPFSGRFADLTVNVPGRALQAADQIFRGMHTQASMRSLAYRQARMEGLRGTALADRITDLLTNPSQKLVDAAADEGAYRVFQQGGDFVNAMGSLREKTPALKVPLPFVQTPYNVAKYALERTPLGAVKIATNRQGGGVLSDRLARAGLGTATMMYFLDKARDGTITGAAPRDPTERDAFFRQGKQPYSIRVGDTWRSYQSLQPLTTLLGAVAGYAEAEKSAGESGADRMTALGAGGLAMGRALIDQPWLQGMSDLIDLTSGTDVRNPDDVLKTVNKYIQQQATSVVPSIVKAVARAQDPTLRDPEQGLQGIPQAIAANIPGLQENAPPKLTAWGAESKRAQEGPGVLFDPTMPSPATTSPLELELDRLQKLGYDVQPGFVTRRVTAFNTPVQLTEEEQRQYQRLAGGIAQELLETVVGSPEWDALSDKDKVETIQKMTDRVRSKVREALQPVLLDRAVDVQMREARQHAGIGVEP